MRKRSSQILLPRVSPISLMSSISPKGRQATFRAFSFTPSAPVPLALLIALVVLAASGCAPSRHTLEPYRSDPVAGAALSARAAEQCTESGRNQGVQPDRIFITDGCSRVLDTAWNTACCVEHDIAYWCGGDRAARLQADTEFGQCIAGETNAFVGWVMKTGVRIGGHPVFPSSYRWGYGHPYRATYPSAVAESVNSPD